jgi:hypothetical protein
LIDKRKSEILEVKAFDKCSDLIQALVEETRKPKDQQESHYEYTNKDIVE